MTYGLAPVCDLGLCNTIVEHLYPILCDFLRDLVHFGNWLSERKTYSIRKYVVNEFKLHAKFLISNRASVASEKILEKIGKSHSPMEMECNNHSCARLQFDVHNQVIQKKIPLRGSGPISRLGLMLQHQ